jgi:hypothetical protein
MARSNTPCLQTANHSARLFIVIKNVKLAAVYSLLQTEAVALTYGRLESTGEHMGRLGQHQLAHYTPDPPPPLSF